MGLSARFVAWIEPVLERFSGLLIGVAFVAGPAFLMAQMYMLKLLYEATNGWVLCGATFVWFIVLLGLGVRLDELTQQARDLERDRDILRDRLKQAGLPTRLE